MVLDTLGQVWPPSVLVIGLLLVGRVADGDGFFEALGVRIAAARLPPRLLLVALLAVVAVVTAVLNLDTSVVFMTPVLLHAARRRGLDERPFLYGAVFMSNSASLLLPGSNLTNLFVVGAQPLDGLAFARQMVLPWLVACALTALVVAVAYPPGDGAPSDGEAPPLVPRSGALAVALTAGLVLLLPEPALPVFAVGVALVVLRRLRPALDVRVLGLLFALTMLLGVVARRDDAAAAAVLGHAGRWQTAALAALTANLVNSLPAAVLFSAHAPPHPRALLLGLDLGPNLAVTGSLSAYLWFQAAASVGARPSIRAYSRLGAVLVPITVAAGIFATGAILTRS